MEYNNFDQNSKGINIEGSFSYDNGLSQIYFTDSIKTLKDGTHVYINHGNIDDEVSFSVKGNKRDLVNYLNDYVGSGYNWKNNTKKDLLDSVDNNLSVSLENFEEVSKDLEEYNITLVPSTPIDYVITRGYSQGDYGKVYFFPEKLKEVWGVKEINESSLQKEIDHLFWDSPIYGSITVNGEELMYEEDTYEWEREKFIESVVKHFGETIREEVENLVPTELNYD